LRRGFVDSSVLVAIAFEEPGAQDLRSRLAAFDELLASSLLEAELASALAREETDAVATHLLEPLHFLLPQRRLSAEIESSVRAGVLRGADLLHVATALFAAPKAELVFLTLDSKQREVAVRLGFEVAP
jgi:predicted nucleic acid-binding protein